MTVTIIALPAAGIRSVKARLNDPAEASRSDWTGHEAILGLAGARWSAHVEIIAGSELALNAWRQFRARLRGRRGGFLLPMVEASQSAVTTCTVDGSGQTGNTLNVQGLPASTTVLRGGQLVQVAAADVSNQLFELAEDVVSNGAGKATMTFGTDMRAAFAAGTALVLGRPAALMRLTATSWGWDADPGIWTPLSFDCEETW